MNKNNGSILLVVALAVVILVMAGAALVVARPAGPPAGVAGGGSGVSFTVAWVRTPDGIAATVTASNNGPQDLKNLRITQADLASMTGGTPLPVVLGKLPRGASTTVTLPFSGPVPAPKSPRTLQVSYDYSFGFFAKGSGSGSLSVTAVVP